MATDKLNLLKALQLAALVTERRATVPILGCTYLAKSVIEATDLDLHLAINTSVVAPKGGLAIQLRPFLAAVKETNETVAFDKDGVTIGTEPSVRLVQTKGDWPTLRGPEKVVEFELPAEQLAADLVTVAPAMSSEETRYYLNGMFWHVADGQLKFAATDGHRLHRVVQDAPAGSEKLGDSIIRSKAIRVLAEMMKLQPSASTMRATFDGLKASFTVGAATLTARLIDGTFPDYNRVIPTVNDKGFRLPAQELVRPASLAMKLLSKGSRGIAIQPKVGTLSAKDPEGTEINARLDLQLIGEPPAQIGFAHEYLVDSLTPFLGQTVTMTMDADSAPCRIENANNDRLLVVLMPMRI